MPTGAAQVATTLRDHGVTTVFGLCGDHTNPLAEACDEAGIRIVDTRDERGAAWMAAGWALGTGTPGVAIVSNTPALLNAAVALADADASGTPVLCITGGVALTDRGRGHPGDADQAELARRWTRWAERAEHANDAGAAAARALHAIRGPRWGQRPGGRPGAAVLELPMDVQHAAADDPRIAAVTLARIVPDPDAIARGRALLSGAQRPVIIAGSGCHWSGAGPVLLDLVERARIPVFTARAARGLISDDHELCLGFPNLMAPAAQIAFGEADVALVVGAKLDLALAGGAFHPGCSLIRVDVDPTAFELGRRAEITIAGDARDVLEHLTEGAEPRPTDAWLARLREAVEARRAEIVSRGRVDTTPMHPARLVHEVAAGLPPEAIVCVDAGELALWAIDAIPARSPASFHASSFSALGALGMGVPWAIGLKMAHPQRPVLALVGDGSFGFCGLEVETAARNDAPIAVVVGNDAGWGIVRHLQIELHGRAIAADLPRSPYEMIGEFARGVGDRVESTRNLSVAITNALASPVPSVINAIIDATPRHPALDLIAAMFRA